MSEKEEEEEKKTKGN